MSRATRCTRILFLNHFIISVLRRAKASSESDFQRTAIMFPKAPLMRIKWHSCGFNSSNRTFHCEITPKNVISPWNIEGHAKSRKFYNSEIKNRGKPGKHMSEYEGKLHFSFLFTRWKKSMKIRDHTFLELERIHSISIPRFVGTTPRGGLISQMKVFARRAIYSPTSRICIKTRTLFVPVLNLKYKNYNKNKNLILLKLIDRFNFSLCYPIPYPLHFPHPPLAYTGVYPGAKDEASTEVLELPQTHSHFIRKYLCFHCSHCTSDYIAVYSGPTTSSPLLKMLCDKQKTSLIYDGQELLVEFRTGPEVPPFDYNGFVATLTFIEMTTEVPTTIAIDSMNKSVEMMKSGSYNNRDLHDHRKDQGAVTSSCDLEVNGEKVRAGHHDTRGKPKSTTCRLVLRGRTYDTGHVSLASYNLSAQSCQSAIEIFDGSPESGMLDTANSLERICSPAQWLPRELAGQDKYAEPKRYSSNGRDMTVVLRRASNSPTDEEYMEISYYFHDEREGGTQQPASVCDVEYYGLTSPVEGSVVHPEPHRLFAMEGPVKCRQHFIPAPNQSVVITVKGSTKQTPNNPCETKCGDSGCHCVSKSLESMDHLLLVSETGHIVTCLCGNYQDWLPVGIRSWTPVYIEWSRSSRAGLNFHAAYKFINDTYCGDHTTAEPEGEVNGGDLASAGLKLNQYYQQKCTWILDSPIDRQLVIEVKSTQSRPCTAWNLTIHEYNKTGDPAGLRLHTFCSRDTHKNFTLPWKMNTAVVRLQALGRTAPQYTMRWRSLTVIANTRQSGPSPAPNWHVVGSSSKTKPRGMAFILVMFAILLARSFDCT
ncbi:hypothetical protein P5V15_002317 [Pogonomyrmex californicus]